MVSNSNGEDQVVEVFTDGSCLGNPGRGGWGVLLRYRGVEKELSGGETELYQQPHGTHGRHPGPGGAETP